MCLDDSPCDTDLRTNGWISHEGALHRPDAPVRTDRLPEGANLQYEVKLDGFRAIAFKSGGKVHLRSRNDKEFNAYPAIVKALAAMSDETVIDREIVTLCSPNLTLTTVFEGVSCGRIYHVDGKALQRWIVKSRSEWKGLRGYLPSQRPGLQSASQPADFPHLG